MHREGSHLQTQQRRHVAHALSASVPHAPPLLRGNEGTILFRPLCPCCAQSSVGFLTKAWCTRAQSRKCSTSPCCGGRGEGSPQTATGLPRGDTGSDPTVWSQDTRPIPLWHVPRTGVSHWNGVSCPKNETQFLKMKDLCTVSLLRSRELSRETGTVKASHRNALRPENHGLSS